jgi:hypothetical protein
LEDFETKLNRFANDYYSYLSAEYALPTNDYQLKVLPLCHHNCKKLIPSPLRQYQKHFNHIYVLWLSKRDPNRKPTCHEKIHALVTVGYPPELAQELANYNIIILLDTDHPICRQNGDILVPNIPIAHHLLHLVEALTNRELVPEQPFVHDYELEEALQPLRNFTTRIGGIDKMLDLYVPCLPEK